MRKAFNLYKAPRIVNIHPHDTPNCITLSSVKMATTGVWILLSLYCALCCTIRGTEIDKERLKADTFVGKRAPAYWIPLNVDPKKDCALKELAWTYAKKLLPQVGLIYE